MNSNGEFEEVTIVSQSNMNSNLGSFNSQEKLDVKASEGKKLNEEQIANLLKSYNEENQNINNENPIFVNKSNNLQNEENKNNKNDIYQSRNLISEYSSKNSEIKITRLSNMGNKSYLNSVLRCIGSLDSLENFFLNEKEKDIIYKNVDNYRLSFAVQRLFVHLKEHKNQVYHPESLWKVLIEENMLFKEDNEINPNICLVHILNRLHDELNKNKNLNCNKNMNINGNDINKLIEMEKNYYQSNNNSIISDNFNWCELKEIKCKKCNQVNNKFQNFFTFELGIQEFYNYKKKNRISIYDCLDYYLGKNIIQNTYCNNCKMLAESEITRKIINNPNIFIFLLNRGDFDEKLMSLNFDLNSEINLIPYLLNKELNATYELKKIVSILNKKYVSFVKMAEDFWYLFNDRDVIKVEHDDVINKRSEMEHVPCILFYELSGK